MTERLVLAPPRHGDAEDLVRAVNDAEVVRWLARVPFPYTLDDAAIFIGTLAPSELVFLARRRDTGELVGSFGLKPKTRAEGELGYWLARAHWGAGFATEAARRLVDYGFGELKLARLTAYVAEANPRSLNVLLKLGFLVTGQSQRPVLFLGTDAPHIDLALDAPTA